MEVVVNNLDNLVLCLPERRGCAVFSVQGLCHRKQEAGPCQIARQGLQPKARYLAHGSPP